MLVGDIGDPNGEPTVPAINGEPTCSEVELRRNREALRGTTNGELAEPHASLRSGVKRWVDCGEVDLEDGIGCEPVTGIGPTPSVPSS